MLKEDEKKIQQQMKLLRTAVNCKMHMCMIFYKDHVTVSYTEECFQHSYILKNSD